MLDDGVCGSHDALCRAVVALQLYQAHAGILFREGEDVADVGASECVDALRVVAHYAQSRFGRGEQADDAVLRIVRVLIFIDEDVLESPHVVVSCFLVVFQEQVHAQQQVVEVHRVGSSTALEVCFVDFPAERYVVVLVASRQVCAAKVIGGQDEAIFRIADACCDKDGLVRLLVELHLAHDCLDERARICRVVDGEVRRESYALGFAAQDAGENAVEGACPQVVGALFAYKLPYAHGHFARSLVSKCECEDVPRVKTMFEKVRNLIREHTRLPRTRTCYDKRRAVLVFYCLQLGFIELFGIVYLVWKFLHSEYLLLRGAKVPLSCRTRNIFVG